MNRSPINSKDLVELQRVVTLARLSADIIKIHKEFNDKVDRFEREIATKIGPRGPKGGKGDKGDNTPRKGIDYFTPGEIREIVELIQSQIRKAEDGERGEDGETPVRGVDYWTETDRISIIQDVLKHIRQPRDGKDAVITTKLILDAIDSLPDDKKPLTRSELEGFKQTISALSHQVGMHGGGDTVAAGTGVTITRNSNGDKVISATGGAGGVSFETPPETSGTSFTVANTPVYIIVNGVTYFEGLGYSYLPGTITLDFDLSDGWIRSAHA
jgi:hypothetical protein